MTEQNISLRQGVTLQVCHSSGKSPALVFVHGGLGNRLNWRSQYAFAQAQGWEALAYDLAGHGQSTPYPRYSIGRHGRDLSRLLRHFNIDQPILCCHSYGVPIGLEWAQRHPVTALILICGGTHNLAPWWEIPLMKALRWGGRYLYRVPVLQQVTDRFSSTHSHETIQQFMVDSKLPLAIHPYQALEIFWGYNFFARRKNRRLQQIPTLVISGGKDPMFTREMGENLAVHLALGQHLHVPEAGHLVMAEFPERVNQAISQFIN